MNLYGMSGEIFLAISGMIALLISVFSSKDSSLKITTRFCNFSLLISLIFRELYIFKKINNLL